MKKIFFLLILAFITLSLNANEFKLSQQKDSSSQFYTYLEFFKDINGTYNKNNLDKLSKETFFKESRERQHLGLSFQIKRLWVKFELFNDSKEVQTRVLRFKNITYENLFLFEKKDSTIKEIPNVKDVNNFYFVLHLKPHRHRYFYVQINANGPYIVDGKLEHIDKAMIANYENGFFFSFFITFISMAIVLYFVLFLGLKRKMYLYFSLYLVGHLLLWLAIYNVYRPIDISLLKVLSMATSTIFIALVTFDFLNMRKEMPKLYRMINFVLVLLFGYYTFSFYLKFTLFQPKIFALFYFATYLLILIAITKAIINKHKAALYYLFAIAGYFIGYNITIGGVFASAKIPANIFTLYIGMLGVIFDIIFVTVAFIIVAKNLYKKQKKQLEEYNQLLESKVQERTQRIREQNFQLQKLSNTDPLTQLSNRLELDRKIKEYYEANDKNSYILLLDIDHFKQINDNYGHLVGDSVLKQIARILRKSLKDNDTIGRWGGEEFLILLKAEDNTTIVSIAQRIRQNVASDIFTQGIRVTLSIGISPLSSANSIQEWIQKSDEALYEAKEAGRNRVIMKL